MNRRKFSTWVLSCGVVALWGCGRSDGSGYSARSGESSGVEASDVLKPTVDLLSLFFTHPLLKYLKALGIVTEASEKIRHKLDAGERRVTFETTNDKVVGRFDLDARNDGEVVFDTPFRSILFCPAGFCTENGVNPDSAAEVAAFDEKVRLAFERCTDDVLQSGEVDLVKMFEARAVCMSGQDNNIHFVDYYQIKVEKYA